MGEAPADPPDPRLAALANVAAMLQWPIPRIRDEAVCTLLAQAIDSVLASVSRGHGALDIAIGEHLDALGTGNRVLRLGYVSVGDYAREMLGIPASTAQKMARFARRLQDCPLLREAVRSGEVSVRQAEAVLPVARGEAEAYWVARARKETVRALQAAVKNPGGRDPDEDEQWDRACFDVPAARRQSLDEAIALAGKALGANAPKWKRLQVLCEEYIGAHATPDGEGLSDPVPAVPVDDWLEHVKECLEKQSKQWADLMQVSPVAVSEPVPDVHADPHSLHEQLRRLSSQRDDWDGVFGHLAMLARRTEAWRHLGFASFGHYCEERLGMSERAVQQRASLERRLYDLPSLRLAMCERRVSYEKARIIARYADAGSLDTWIERAGRMSCVALRAALQGEEEAQMCARGNFEVVVPRHIRGLLAMAFHAVRNAAGEWMPPGECLVRIAEHFLEVWKPALEEPDTPRKRVLERDLGLCQAWGCTRAAAHVHHIQFRSAGGSDDATNLVSLCAAHHLQCVHNGWIRVRGKAPDGLYWELGVRPGRPPLVVVGPATASAETS